MKKLSARSTRCYFQKRSASAGLAFLEAASVSVVLILLLTGAVASIQYLSHSTSIQQTVDRHVYESAVKPFRLQIGFNGDIEPQFLEAEIYRRVEEIRGEILDQLVAVLPPELQDERSISIQTAYAAIAVDTATGRVDASQVRLRALPAAGGLMPPAVFLAEFDLEREFNAYLAAEHGDGSSLAAIPRGLVAGGAGDDRFFPLAVLIGARAIVSLERSSLGRLLQLVTIQPWLGARKVVGLRGDLGR